MSRPAAKSNDTRAPALPSQSLARHESERLYAEIAADYDRHLLRDCDYRSPTLLARLMAEWVSSAESPVTDPWLELGAGTGLLGAACRAKKLDLRWVALDLSQPMLEALHGAAYRCRLRADALEGLPFRRESLAGAAAVGLMEHVVEPAKLFGGLQRVLRVGALFFFTYCPSRAGQHSAFETEPTFMSHDEVQLTGELEDAGFVTLETRDAGAYLNGPDGWVTHRLVVARRS